MKLCIVLKKVFHFANDLKCCATLVYDYANCVLTMRALFSKLGLSN